MRDIYKRSSLVRAINFQIKRKHGTLSKRILLSSRNFKSFSRSFAICLSSAFNWSCADKSSFFKFPTVTDRSWEISSTRFNSISNLSFSWKRNTRINKSAFAIYKRYITQKNIRTRATVPTWWRRARASSLPTVTFRDAARRSICQPDRSRRVTIDAGTRSGDAGAPLVALAAWSRCVYVAKHSALTCGTQCSLPESSDPPPNR